MHLKWNLAQRRWINVSTNAALLILMLNAHLFIQHSTLGQKANAWARIDLKSWTENSRPKLWRAYAGGSSWGHWTSCFSISPYPLQWHSELHNWQASMQAQHSRAAGIVWFHIEVVWGWDTSSPFSGRNCCCFFLRDQWATIIQPWPEFHPLGWMTELESTQPEKKVQKDYFCS